MNLQPFFSIVVPTYNRPSRLQACLQALDRLDYPRHQFEVVIVDDGSTMQLEPIVAPFRNGMDVRLLRQENAGPAAARNAGAAAAYGTWIAFTDDDCMPRPDWLYAFARRCATGEDQMIGGQIINALPKNVFSTASQQLVSYLYAYYNAMSGHASFFTSNNIALPSASFHAVGGFDTTFLHAAGEDREFCDRWLHLGHRMTYAPEAIVLHAHYLDGRRFLRQHFSWGRAAYVFHQKRQRRSQSRLTPEPLRFYTDLLSFPFSANTGWRAWTVAFLFGVSQVANAAGFFWERSYTESRMS